MTGTCPVCGTEQRITPTGNVGHHATDRMRWSGRRWFRIPCRGVGRPSEPAPSGADGSEEAR